MAPKYPKRPRDLNQWAKLMVDLATGNATDYAIDPSKDASTKNLGQRRGGLKGGPARAAKLTPERRAEIARKAAQKRWGK